MASANDMTNLPLSPVFTDDLLMAIGVSPRCSVDLTGIFSPILSCSEICFEQLVQGLPSVLLVFDTFADNLQAFINQEEVDVVQNLCTLESRVPGVD